MVRTCVKYRVCFITINCSISRCQWNVRVLMSSPWLQCPWQVPYPFLFRFYGFKSLDETDERVMTIYKIILGGSGKYDAHVRDLPQVPQGGSGISKLMLY